VGSPARLRFSVVKDPTIDFTEGNLVNMQFNGAKVFSGFVFKKERDKERIIDVTAYCQLRYLKNKDTYSYTNKKASDVLKMIASDFNLNTGIIADTGYNIPSRIEDNQELFSIIYNALDQTLLNNGKLYNLYDDFGKLTLSPLESMKVNIVVDEETGQNFEYTSSIDDNTYNRIKLVREDKSKGIRDVFIAQDGDKWGVLQLFDTLQDGENGQAKADAMLALYNVKSRKIKINRNVGDVRVRAGTTVVTSLNLGDIVVGSYMLVDKAVHIFENDTHFMDLTLRGGDYGV
jgi:hypothetical protein